MNQVSNREEYGYEGCYGWVHRSKPYERRPSEYISPPGAIIAVSPESAKFCRDRNDLPLDELYGFWTFARGNDANLAKEWGRPVNRVAEVFVELVPEPGNPFDSGAVAVDLDGKRVGYVSARFAMAYHWRIRVLNNQNLKVLVPAKYSTTHVQGRGRVPVIEACLPTFRHLDKLLPAQEFAFRELAKLWLQLDPAVVESVAFDQFHLSPEAFESVYALRATAPSAGLPSIPLRSAPMGYLDKFLRLLRINYHACGDAVEQYARYCRNRQIVVLRNEGLTYRGISERCGVGQQTVSKIYRRVMNGSEPPSPFVGDAELVNALLAMGESPREIAQTSALGEILQLCEAISEDSDPQYLTAFDTKGASHGNGSVDTAGSVSDQIDFGSGGGKHE